VEASPSSWHADLAGRWAVVTGASKGIGAAIAEAFVEAGGNVVLVARGRQELESLARQLQQRASEAQQVRTRTSDVADPTSIAELFSWLRNEIPRLDIFVANAGTGSMSRLVDLSLDHWNEIVALNLTGTMLCCQAAARLMLTNPGGDRAILVISSIRALRASPGRLAYSVTKAGVNQMIRVAATELAPDGIRVNGLSPGITETPLTQRHPEAFAQAVATVPLQRAGAPRDMASAALFLCSPASRFTTGANLVVDGGEVLA
jgi:glucose 1-dehydrogenase